MSKQVLMTSLKVLSQYSSEWTEENQKKPHDSQNPGRDSNIGLQEYTSDALLHETFSSVIYLHVTGLSVALTA
jgi:hypothetical protein